MSEHEPGGSGPDEPGRAGPGPLDPELEDRVRGWIADDPDPDDRAELAALRTAAGLPGPAGQAARADLADRFAGRLEFGTAGLRGAMGAGPNRMNRAVVLGAAAALARWLHEHQPGTVPAGVVLGWDARHRSAGFAQQAAAVLTGAGIPVYLLPDRSPTPLLAFAVRHLGAAAGVMITASHNPPADNGYKLYLGDGAQIVPPVNAQIEALIRGLGPLADVPLGAVTGPLITRHGDEIAQAYLAAVVSASPATHPAPGAAGPGQRTGPGAGGAGHTGPGQRTGPGAGGAGHTGPGQRTGHTGPGGRTTHVRGPDPGAGPAGGLHPAARGGRAADAAGARRRRVPGSARGSGPGRAGP